MFSDFGPATYILHNTVTMKGHGYGNITLVAPKNTTYQFIKIVSLPQAFVYHDGLVSGNFNVSGEKIFNIIYTVHVNYTSLRPGLFKKDILNKIIKINNEIYTSFSYDIHSQDYQRTMTDILDKKSGTCVAYARAESYLLNQSSISTSFVYGYSYKSSVYHVWLVYKGPLGNVEFDPTYGEIGLLGNDHLAFGYVSSPKLTDIKLKYYGNLSVSHKTLAKLIKSSKYSQNISCNFSYQNGSIILNTVNRDPTKFMFKNVGTFSEKPVVGSVYGLDRTIIPFIPKDSGVVYSLDLSARYNDVICNKTLVIGNPGNPPGISQNLLWKAFKSNNLMLIFAGIFLIGLLLYVIGKI